MDVETNSLPLKPPIEDEQDVQDATDLAAMGHAQALTRKFNIWSMLALAFCVLGMRHPLAVARVATQTTSSTYFPVHSFSELTVMLCLCL